MSTDQAGELTSVSVASGHTNNTEDQQTLMQSLISMGGLRDAGEFEEGILRFPLALPVSPPPPLLLY